MSTDRRIMTHNTSGQARRVNSDRRHDDTRAIVVVERRGTGVVEREKEKAFRWQPFERRVANTYTATDFDRRVRKGHLNRRKPQDPGAQGLRIQADAERRGKMVPVERSLRSYAAMDGSKFLRRPGETHEETMARLTMYNEGPLSASDFDKRRAEWTRECVGEFKPTERRQSTRLNMTDFHRREIDDVKWNNEFNMREARQLNLEKQSGIDSFQRIHIEQGTLRGRDVQCDELQAVAGDRLIATDGRVFMRVKGESYASMKDRVDAYHETLQASSGERLRKDLEAYARGFGEKPPFETETEMKERIAAKVLNEAFGKHPGRGWGTGVAPEHLAADRAEFQQARLKTIALDLKRDINQLFDHVIEGPSKRTNNAGEAYVVLGLRGAVGSEQQLFDSILAMCKVLRLCGMLAIKPDGEHPVRIRPCPVLYWRRDPEFTYEDSVWSDTANDFQPCDPCIKVTVRLVASQVVSANMRAEVERGEDRRGEYVTRRTEKERRQS